MLCFEVSLNGKRLATAAHPEEGVLSCHVAGRRTVEKGGRVKEELDLRFGGLDGATDVFVDWLTGTVLARGDVVEIRILESETADAPRVRQASKELGLDPLGLARMEVNQFERLLEEARAHLKRLEAQEGGGGGK